MNPIYVALDTPELKTALALAEAVRPHVGGVKVGLEFVSAHGPEGVRQIVALGLPVFLDVKLHDIPNTVAGAVRALSRLGVSIVNIHTAGGRAMMQAAKDAAGERMKVIGVTILTSLDDADMDEVGYRLGASQQALHLARLAQSAGLDGVVCSSVDLPGIRAACGKGFLTVVPGSRPLGSDVNDQKRFMTPGEAQRAGADILILGRPVTAAADPGIAAKNVLAELEAGVTPPIKICGLTTRAGLDAAAFAGATHAGFMFFPKSPRAVTHDQARALVVGCPPELTRVAVLVDPDDDAVDAAIVASGAQMLQLHGSETPERVAALKARTHLPIVKALPVAEAGDVAAASRYAAADMILFDAKPPRGADRPGGHGTTFDWSLLSGVRLKQAWLLSGGLTPDTVGAAIAATRPPGVDVSSGVETSPGAKDPALIVAFASAARAAFDALVLEPQS